MVAAAEGRPLTEGWGEPIEQYVLLARGVKGASARALVERAVAAPGVFVFGELLGVPTIAALADADESRAHHRLLELFAYGTYGDFIERRDSLPPLSEPMQLKLRQLTLASLAARDRRIPYAQLMRLLHLSDVRELEDVVIDAIYKGVVSGKLDPRDQCVVVHGCLGRDVRAADVTRVVGRLADWSSRCVGLLADLEQQIERANCKKEASVKERLRVEQEQKNLRKTLKTAGGGGRSETPEMDEAGEVSSSRTVNDDRKKESKRLRSGLRGSATTRATHWQGKKDN